MTIANNSLRVETDYCALTHASFGVERSQGHPVIYGIMETPFVTY